MENFILAILILKLVLFSISFLAVFYFTRPKRKKPFDNYKLRRNEEYPGTKKDAAITGIHDIIPKEFRQYVN